MDFKNYQITVKELLAHPKARQLIQREFPMVLNSKYVMLVQNATLAQVMEFAKGYLPQAKMNHVLTELKKL